MPSEWQVVATAITLSNGNYLRYVPGFLLSYTQISAWNHSLIIEIKPKHIYLPARLNHSTFVFLVVTVSPGGPCATCSVSGRKMIPRKWAGGVFALPSDFQWARGGTWACSLNSHCTVNKSETLQQEEKKKTHKKKDWWVALSRNVPGCVFKVNFLNYEKLLFFCACISLLQCQNFCCVKLFSCIAECFSIK